MSKRVNLKFSSRVISIVISFVIVSLGAKSWGTLGLKDDSLETEAALAGAKHALKILPHYNLHDVTSTNLDVKQYADKDGIVFGVSWRGGHVPDLQALFGMYFQDYSQSVKSAPHRRTRGGPQKFKGSSLVVEQSGHMRSLYGRAYVPSLIPTGVSANDIK